MISIPIQYKILKTGHLYQVHYYEKPVTFERNYKSKSDSLPDPDSDNNLSIQKAAFRAKSKIRKLILGNMHNHTETPKFITLTFDTHITELSEANHLFSMFRKRLHRTSKKHIDYIAVHERQESGRIHYHMLMLNMPFIHYTKFENDVWQYGGTNMKRVYRTKGIFKYVTKYMTKSFSDPDAKHKKRYFQNLKYQTEVILDQHEARLYASLLAEKQPLSKPEKLYMLSAHSNTVANTLTKTEYLAADV